MLRRIVVPLDGSERAERALPFATRLASQSGGSLVLVRVISESAYAPPPLGILDGKPDPSREAEDYLHVIASGADVASVTVETVVIIGSPAVEILHAADSSNADAIVMCSHGRSGLAKWTMGSVAQKVGRHATVPVLVIKEFQPVPVALSSRPARDLRVLLPLDGSPVAEAAIPPTLALLAGLAIGGTAYVQLLRVVDLSSIYGRVGVDADEDQTLRVAVTSSAREYLSQMADQVRNQLPAGLLQGTVSWSVATGVDPAAIITDTAAGRVAHAADEQSLGFDLIAMATHGRGGVGLWAVGSVTERVLMTSTLPMLIVRPVHGRGRAEDAAMVRAEPWSTPLF
jgi:nucleotide-binding universal stress UspA family protein